jgi:hypothetical protein
MLEIVAICVLALLFVYLFSNAGWQCSQFAACWYSRTHPRLEQACGDRDPGGVRNAVKPVLYLVAITAGIIFVRGWADPTPSGWIAVLPALSALRWTIRAWLLWKDVREGNYLKMIDGRLIKVRQALRASIHAWFMVLCIVIIILLVG